MSDASEDFPRVSLKEKSLRALILRQELSPDSTVADRDVLAQVEAVERALVSLGCETSVAECSLDLARLLETLESQRPDFVFNLVESLSGSDRMAPVAAAALEAFGV